MKLQRTIITITSCCVAMLAPAAFGQGTPGSGAGAGAGANVVHYGSAGEEPGGQGSRFGGPLEGGSLAMQPGQNQIMFRASRLVGMNAASPQGQELGKVDEIVFHPQIGILAVVSTPTGRIVPIPWQLVSAITGKTLVFNTTLQALDAAPTITGGEWANFNSPVFTHEIFAYFGVPPHAPMVAGAFGGGRNFGGNQPGYGGGYGQRGYGATTGSNQGYGAGNGGYGSQAGYGGEAGYGGNYGTRGGYGNESATTGGGYGGTGAGVGGQSQGHGSRQGQQSGSQGQQSGSQGQQSGSQGQQSQQSQGQQSSGQNSGGSSGNQNGNSSGGQQ